MLFIYLPSRHCKSITRPDKRKNITVQLYKGAHGYFTADNAIHTKTGSRNETQFLEGQEIVNRSSLNIKILQYSTLCLLITTWNDRKFGLQRHQPVP